MKTEIIETGTEYRAFGIDNSSIDKDARTVEVLFSSEYPVPSIINGQRGLEVLDHNPESVDLGRLNNGGPVLLDHDKRQHVGVIDSARICGDKVGRALVRFGRSQLADEAFNDVVDGIRRFVSVGYKVQKYVAEMVDGTRVFRATRWLPFEITFTSVPADPTAEVGRSYNLNDLIQTEVLTMDTEKEVIEDKPAEMPKIEVNRELESIKRRELARIDDIRKIGEVYNCEDLARSGIDQGWSVDQMNKSVLEIIAEKQARKEPVTAIGLSKRETQGYSLMRAIVASYSNDWSKAGFEMEASRAIEDELGRPPQGFYIPWEIQNKQRVMTVGTDSAGGYLKGTDHLGGSFIELLRANALMGSLNARFLPGLTGDIDIPRLDAGATFGWVTEDADGALSDATLGTVAMAPKTVTGQVPISRRLLKQSSPSVEQMLMEDMARGAGLAIDLAAFSGTGAAGQPTGVTVAAGTSTSTILAPGAPTWVELVEFETDVAAANGLRGTLAYVTTAPVNGNLKTTKKDAGSGIFLIEGGQANGYRVEVSTQLAANTIIFGNWEDVIIGLWGVLDVEPDKAAKAAAGGLVLRVFQDVDVGIRHAASFSKNA